MCARSCVLQIISLARELDLKPPASWQSTRNAWLMNKQEDTKYSTYFTEHTRIRCFRVIHAWTAAGSCDELLRIAPESKQFYTQHVYIQSQSLTKLFPRTSFRVFVFRARSHGQIQFGKLNLYIARERRTTQPSPTRACLHSDINIICNGCEYVRAPMPITLSPFLNSLF